MTYDTQEEEEPFCSVLNVVIDHGMQEPTTMEQEEYENGQGKQKVPVIRIFGSVLRPTSTNPPLQSACLHIHGAFPYLLARPRVAGPDGSLKRFSEANYNVNWDDLQAVEGIVESLHENLESALQSFDLERQNNNNNTMDASKQESNKQKIIRKITVVEGRGFYSYCPGPPAPFLRVEYFDPKLRWKVKLLLEKGLDVPERYHPDARLYDRDEGLNVQLHDRDPLKFHCYEAHIPYSMQFFKDWNLSGMSYIHLRNVKIRPFVEGQSVDYIKRYRTDSKSTKFLNGHDFILPSNVPDSSLWDESLDVKRDTSCDVEMDCRIEDILNKEAVIKTMPEDQDDIYWRAVPSLQEIWRQERIRMKSLLGPRHELVSKPFSFTLNVKKDAPKPGSRPAVKGMRNLISDGVKDNFKRALSQILKRHEKAIQRLDEQTTSAEGEDPQSFYAEDDIAMSQDDTPTLTPTLDSAIDALGSLKATGNDTRKSNIDPTSHTKRNSRFSLSAEESPSQLQEDLEGSQFSTSNTPLPQSQLLYACSQDLHQTEMLATQGMDPMMYSQKIEQGSSVIGGLDGIINPETLLPYKMLEFGNDTCRVIFEVESDPVGTRRVCGGKAGSCCRGHPFDAERAKPRYYETVTTGAGVDGILRSRGHEENTFQEDRYDIQSSDDELTESEEEMEKVLMATQIQDSDRSDEMALDFRNRTPRTQLYPELAQNFGTQASSNFSNSGGQSGSYTSDEDSIDEESTNDQDLAKALKGNTTINVQPSFGSQEKSVLAESCQFSPPANIFPRRNAPTRAQVSGSLNRLHPLAPKDYLPTWLGHTGKYSLSNKSHNHNYKGYYVRPISMPPTRGKVIKWYKKKGRTVSKEVPAAKREKVEKGMEIDSNSRKIVPHVEQSTSSSTELTSPSHCQKNVEEVKWELTQPWQLSASQTSSQNEMENERFSQPSQEAKSATSNSLQASEGAGSFPSDSVSNSGTQNSGGHALEGIGNQGGRIHIQGGGGLKTRTKISQNCDHQNLGGTDNTFGLPSPISFMSIEIHVQCRNGESRLDKEKKIAKTATPTNDKVSAIVYIYGRDPGGGKSLEVLSRGCLFVPLRAETMDKRARDEERDRIRASIPRATMGFEGQLSVECIASEKSLFMRFVSIVRMKDPDMLLSWDTQGAGLGYLIERGFIVEQDLATLLGRTPKQAKKSMNGSEEKGWQGSGLGGDWDDKVGAGAAASSVIGRLVFAGWKIVAEEVKHANASYLPAVVSAVLNKRIPHPDNLTLTRWYASGNERWRALNHQLLRASSYMLIFDALDIIGRAGEAARLSGVEFSQSFPGIRGSQYKVEGVLLRALQSLRSDERGSKKGKVIKNGALDGESTYSNDNKSPTQEPWKLRRQSKSSIENRHYFFFSPSLQDTEKQEALEYQALTLEPQSGHYSDPVVVCDFTALYPSLIIAYNLCYSTIAGKLEYHSTRQEMQLEGRTTEKIGPIFYPEQRTATVLADHLKSLRDPSEESSNSDRAYVAPTGAIYVSEDVVKGVLPQVLEEMLATRAMLKAAAKEYKRNVKNLSPAILRQLEARQLALKYVANVTYGYTSATFSGRCAMPLLADTIVACGRSTLRQAIVCANQWGRENGPWNGANVVYGDTDSLFVTLPGRSHKEGFDFGEQLCEAVRMASPPPVELKLEKVYVQSIMQTMKRYCGMKFESQSQKKPTFEAKGLEIVRRDQCALTQKILRNALITLFRSGIDAVKEYLFRQWSLIYSGNLPVADFILTGRVRSRYRGDREGPVQAVLASRIREADEDFMVLNKARLPYVIVSRSGALRLKDSVLTPLELLEHWNAYTIHSGYYIEKHVNASLQRCLGLKPHHIDISAWYQECPKPRRRTHFWPVKYNNTQQNLITNFFVSGVCSFCGKKADATSSSKVSICHNCRRDPVRCSQLAFQMLNLNEQAANEIAKECQACNGCFESADTFVSVAEKRVVYPVANCVCIDCPNTFARHRLREQQIETTETIRVLDLTTD